MYGEMMSSENKAKKKINPSLILGGAVVAGIIVLFFVFPVLVSAISGQGLVEPQNPTPTSGSESIGTQNPNLQTINLQVQIPCGGHSSLIVSELNKINGVSAVKLVAWNKFQVTFDSAKTSKELILDAEVFNSYPATVIN